MVVTSGMCREENVLSFDVKLILLKGVRQPQRLQLLKHNQSELSLHNTTH